MRVVLYSQDAYDKYTETHQSATIKASGGIYGGGSECLVCAGFSPQAGKTAGISYSVNESPTLQTSKEMGLVIGRESQYIVRRLTPLECCRLQGMPDWWCADVPHSDAPEYKMWGNGMALPCAMYVMEGIAEIFEEEKT